MDSGDIGVREFVERILTERDRLYEARFLASEKGIQAAFLASEKAIDSALVAAEKALQAALAASDKAIQTAFGAAEKAVKKAEEAQSGSIMQFAEFRKQIDEQREGLSRLRDSMSGLGGKSQGMNTAWGMIIGAVALIASIAAIVSAWR